MRVVKGVRGLYTFIPIRNLCTDFVPIVMFRFRLTVIMEDDCGRIWKEPFVTLFVMLVVMDEMKKIAPYVEDISPISHYHRNLVPTTKP